MPIVHMEEASLSPSLPSPGLLSPEALTKVSQSMLDLSNLGKMGALSVSSPALAADLGGGLLWRNLRKKKKKTQDSSSYLLDSADTLNTGQDTFVTQLSAPVSPAHWQTARTILLFVLFGV